MHNKILLLIFTVLTISCKSQNKLNYAEHLSGCLTDNDIELLNKVTHIFEQKLYEYYGDKNDSKNFISFLNDLSSRPPILKSPEFYYNDQTIKLLEELKQNETYGKIWIDNDDEDYSLNEDVDIVQLEGVNVPNSKELKMTVINPNGDYLNCIINNYSNTTIKEVLIAQSKYGDIATSILASVLRKQLTEKDFDNELNKLIVAISLYYDMTIFLKNNPRK